MNVAKMWVSSSTSKTDLALPKDIVYNDLYTECRLAAPGARLSYNIRTKMDRFVKDERKAIVSRVKDGCAPLFIACKKGNVEIVEYLLSHCDADVEQRGMYEVPDDRSIHFVTPLWCASVAGKLGVVKCLVEHGADVNSVSDTGSTPVRSACFMTHYEIVVYLVQHNADILKPNYNGGTCLINSVQSVPLCDFLLQNGAVVNAQDIQFKTALHYAIQEHRFETAKLLLDHGADPFIQSRYGDDALQTACLKGAVHVFDYLKEKFIYSPERIACAHELMGSTFLDEHHDLQKTLFHWRKALTLRQTSTHSPLPKKPRKETNYLIAKEFATFEDLENLALDLDAMRIQSLLVCERILGPLHRDMIFRLMYRGAAYADSLQYQRCIDLWRYALDLRIQKDSLLHSEVCFAAQALVRLFLDLYEKNRSGVLHEELQYSDVFLSIKLLANQLQSTMQLLSHRPIFKKQHDNFDKVLKVLAHFFYILHVIRKSEVQVFESKCLIRDIIRLQPCTSSGDTLLHMVVSRATTMKTNTFFEDSQALIFPNPELTELLLMCGADVDATNFNRSTALHIAAQRNNYHEDIIKALLNYGAHIDRRNINGVHPHTMLRGITECTVNPLYFVTLKCLAARKLMEYQISYRGEVPADLLDFISIH